MLVEIDHDVKAVAEFMEKTVPASKLMGVATRLAEIANLMWRDHDPEDVAPMRLVKTVDPRAINSPQPNEISPLAATECCLESERAHDGSVAEAACL